MRISHLEIDNFRNFHKLRLDLAADAVIVGENKIGKSNLLYALRLVLDPRMPDSDRRLRLEDFWDGLPRPPRKKNFIRIAVDLTDFEDNPAGLGALAEHAISTEPYVSRLTYLFRPKPTLVFSPRSESDYEFILFGGDDQEAKIGYDLRQSFPVTVLPALRNAEDDLLNWRYSPLAPLLQEAAAQINRNDLKKIAKNVLKATSAVARLPNIEELAEQIHERLVSMIGKSHAVTTNLGFSPTAPDRLIRSLRLFIDDGVRGVGEASLGSANLLYLTLLMLELERQVAEGERSHTFLAIEEPEAHLHPHLQRLVFRNFLRSSSPEANIDTAPRAETVLLTTHSPHIVSVAPLKSIVLLKKSADENSTVGVSSAKLELTEEIVGDLERYLDVNRGEIVFAKGVLLVEGPAEEFVIPVIGNLLGYEFDELGISVCSINGTHFDSYVQLIGPNGLDLPFAVITDGDPIEGSKTRKGDERAINLVTRMSGKKRVNKTDRGQLLREARARGIFVGRHTLEVDLFRRGQHLPICETLAELTSNAAARERSLQWKNNPQEMDPLRLVKDIQEIGKGRFAQRLASRFTTPSSPPYIKRAIKHVAKRIG